MVGTDLEQAERSDIQCSGSTMTRSDTTATARNKRHSLMCSFRSCVSATEYRLK